MTDNEIIANEILCIRRRASNKCNGGTDCNTCDLIMDETEIIEAYQRAMKQNDLINRQKAEIERLEKEIKDKERAYNDEFCLRKEWQTKCRELLKEKQIIKSEAIKDFAERLKEYELCMFCSFPNNKSLGSEQYIVLSDSIDDLVKEMTEEIEK